LTVFIRWTWYFSTSSVWPDVFNYGGDHTRDLRLRNRGANWKLLDAKRLWVRVCVVYSTRTVAVK